ncbi:MAG: biopolymer transporter ExbD, partial [Nitrospiraceae bacterium]|nr:biopolymer transporter ExbD [Nitrospiraceae bacterium]
PLEIKKEMVTIEISPNKLAIKGKEVTLNELEQELKKINDKKKPITLRIDEEVKYKKIVDVLDILQKYGLNNLDLVTKKKN